MSYFSSKSRTLLVAAFVAALSAGVLIAQQQRNISGLIGRTDDNLNLYVRGAAAGAAGQSSNIGGLVGRTDANLNLYVTFDATVPSAMGTTTFPDGLVGAPSIAFTSAPTTGFYLNGTSPAVSRLGVVQGQWPGGGGYDLLGQAAQLRFGTAADTYFARTAIGNLSYGTATIGVQLKADALPTAGTCGTAPAVTAGSTPLAGSIDVGTGTPASCIVTFGGTAWPSAPFCTANVVTATAGTVRALGVTTTTTAMTLTPASAFVASTVVAWHCISSK